MRSTRTTMTTSRAATRARAHRAALYVEGAGDRAILQGWARAVSPALEHAVRETTVILGGRQPARAREHFARLRAHAPGARGLCILDRDALAHADAERAHREADVSDGLEVYVWRRRHIESYLLAPDAIRRALRVPDQDARLQRWMAEHVPHTSDERAFAHLHAKRLLASHGPLARAFACAPAPSARRGARGLSLGRIARGMRPDEMHPEVRALLARLARVFGLAPQARGRAPTRL